MRLAAVVRARLASIPVVALALPWQCNLVPPAADGSGGAQAALIASAGANGARGAEAPDPGPSQPSAAAAKQEAPSGRVSSSPPRTPPPRTVTLPDQVIVKAMGVGQPAFLRCWARAQRIDGLSATKVHLHIELDASGKVTASESDSDSPVLSSCLALVARRLPFPAPGRAVSVDLPLMFP